MTNNDKYALEGFIDKTSAQDVIDAIGEILYEKAGHIEENWQDYKLAKQYERAGAKVQRFAGTINV